MAKKTAQASGTRRLTPVHKAVSTKRPGRAESWKKTLERNLILEGYSPAEAKELVAISAA